MFKNYRKRLKKNDSLKSVSLSQKEVLAKSK